MHSIERIKAMGFAKYESVVVKATGEKGKLCRAGSSATFHIDTSASNYVKCHYVEMESTGEIRSYLETALATAA